MVVCLVWLDHGCAGGQIDVEYLHPQLFVDAKASWRLPGLLTPLQSTDPAYIKEFGNRLGQRKEGGVELERVVAPELLLVDRLWFLPFIALHLILHLAGVSKRGIFVFFTTPSLVIPILILFFNVAFHPPNITPTSAGCYALDSLLDPLAVLFGEAAHEDHHLHPDRARRPGFVDVSFTTIITPLLAFGVIWDPKNMATSTSTASSMRRKAE